MVDKADLITSN